MEFHAGQPSWGQAALEQVRLAECPGHEHDLQWHEWTRYSSRQRQKMTLGGALGAWTLHGHDDTLASYRSVRESEKQLARALNIELVCGPELVRLRERILGWVRGTSA